MIEHAKTFSLIVVAVVMVVLLVTGLAYASFIAWVSFLVLCLQKAHAWGWWP